MAGAFVFAAQRRHLGLKWKDNIRILAFVSWYLHLDVLTSLGLLMCFPVL